MKLGASEIELLQIELGNVIAYLQKTGWARQISVNENATIWTKWNAAAGNEEEILLPSNREVGDYTLRLAEALEGLSRFEERTFHAVVADVKRGGRLRVLQFRDWKVSLIRFWGLDVYGLSGFGRRTSIELFFAAAIMTAASLFDFLIWSLLFVMFLGSRLIMILLALAFGLVSTFSTAIYRRSFFVAILSVRGARRVFRVSLFLALATLLTIISVPPVALTMFRVPISEKVASGQSESTVEGGDFFDRLRALDELLKQSDEHGEMLRTTYYLIIVCVAATTMLPVLFVFLLGEELRLYYSLSWVKASRDEVLSGVNVTTERQAPNQNAAPDG